MLNYLEPSTQSLGALRVLFSIFLLLLFNVCEVLPTSVYVHHPWKPEEGNRFPQQETQMARVTTEELGPEPGSFARAATALNH